MGKGWKAYPTQQIRKYRVAVRDRKLGSKKNVRLEQFAAIVERDDRQSPVGKSNSNHSAIRIDEPKLAEVRRLDSPKSTKHFLLKYEIS